MPAIITFLLWCALLIICWPLALAALVIYPLLWLLFLPFRLLGTVVGGVFALLSAFLFLPFRLVRGSF